ncbi:MAG: pyridoxal phosphate-dependent aminotransferase [Planctomycetota bacterium]|nr:pyridoxal phosphate-dependent aminotransferase [Planctomycetota bacterium]
MKPNARATALEASATLALDARAKELRAAGVDVVNMAVGEPDFEAPAIVRATAARKAERGPVKYTQASGTPELRTTLAMHMTTTRGVAVSAAEVIVNHSCKHSLATALQILVEPGDEILLPAPIWNSYFEQVRFVGGTPILVQPRPDLGPDFAGLAAAITPRTRGIMINTPCNPSGYVWTAAELAQLGALMVERDLWGICDEIYQRLVYEGEPFASLLAVDDEVRARTVVVDGASKAFAMTGYRMGALIAPVEIVEAADRLQSQLTGCPNAISMSAWRVALADEPPEVAVMAAAFDERRKVLMEGLRGMGLETPWPRGAFYAFPSVAPYLDERGSAGFCADLLESEALAIVPGAVFGMDEHVRFSYATSLDNVREALARMERFLER